MVEDGLSVLKCYYCNVNILIIHTICIVYAFLKSSKEYYMFPLFHVVYS